MLNTLQDILSPTQFFNELKNKITTKEIVLSQINMHKSKPLYENILKNVLNKEEELHFYKVQNFHKTNDVSARSITQGMMIEMMYQAIVLIQICVALQDNNQTLIDLPKAIKQNTSMGDFMYCVLSPKQQGILYQLEYKMTSKRGKYGLNVFLNKLVGRSKKVYFEKSVKDLNGMIDVMFNIIDECINLFDIKEQPNGKRIIAKGNIDLRKGIPPFKTLKLIQKSFNHNRYYFTDDLPTNLYSYNIIKEFLNNRLKK